MVCNKRVTIFESPDERQIEKTKNELGEDDDRLRHTEQILHEWIACQPHFPKNYEKNYVRSFLRGAKHDMERTKRALEGHFSAKHAFKELYSDRDPFSKEICKAINNLNVVFLPKLTKNGERVSIFSMNNPKIEDFDMTLNIKLVLMIYDLILTSEAPVCGEIIIFNANNFTPAHFVKFFSPIFRSLMHILRECYAIRNKQVHVVNAPAAMEKMIATIKPLLPEKVKKRVYIHKGVDSLYEHIPKEILPEDFGGREKALRSLMIDWHEVLKQNYDWFKEQEDVKIVESSPKFSGFQNQLGVEGSFRKLTID